MTKDGAQGAGERSHVVISEKLVAVNSASFVLTRLVNISVIVWVYQYLLKRIPTEEFAVYPVVAAIMVIAPVFFTMFTGGIARSAVEAYAKGDRTAVTRIVSSIFPLIAAMSLAFLVLGVGFASVIELVLNIPSGMEFQARLMMILLVAAFVVQMVLLPFSIGFQIHQKYVELNVLALLREVLRLIVLVTLLSGFGAAVIWVVVAAFIADVSYTLAMVWRSRRLVPELRLRPKLFDGQEARGLLSFGIWVSLGQLGMVMYTHAATIVLNLYGSPTDVTVYFIGATIYRQLQTLIRVATQPLLPVITAMQADDDIPRVRRTLLRGGRYALWVSMLPAAALLVYAEDFILLYIGPDYRSAAVVIVLFMAIFPFDRATTLLPMTCMAMARVREFFLPAFLFQLAGLVLMVFFAASLGLGAVGVTLALAAITIGSQLSYFWWLALRLTDARAVQFWQVVLWPGWLPAAAGAMAWTGISAAWTIDSWLKLGVSVVAGSVVYVGVLLRFALDETDRSRLKSLLARRLKKG